MKRILKSARLLFSKHGYAATTMQNIVTDAETSIGNLYFYFANKEDLLKALMDEAAQQNWAHADEIAAMVKPGPARVAVVVYTNVTSLTGPIRDLARIALEGSPAVVQHIIDIHAARMRTLINESFPGRSKTELELMAAAVFGANRACVEQFVFGKIGARSEQIAEFLVRWHLHAMLVPEKEITNAIRTVSAVLAKLRGRK